MTIVLCDFLQNKILLHCSVAARLSFRHRHAKSTVMIMEMIVPNFSQYRVLIVPK